MALATFQGPIRSLGGVYTQGPATVVPVSTATLTLNPVDHGGRILNITAATTTITLPTVNASTNPASSGPGQDPNTLNNFGVLYTFVLPTNATNVKVITGSASDFLIGGVDVAVDAGASTMFAANGSSIVSINLNGTTKGGIAGSWFTMVSYAANRYLVQGQLIGSSTLVTPFATS